MLQSEAEVQVVNMTQVFVVEHLKPQMFEFESKIFFYLCKLTKQAPR